MFKISELNRTLLFMLIFTVISSAIAFHIIVTGYSTIFDLASAAQ